MIIDLDNSECPVFPYGSKSQETPGYNAVPLSLIMVPA